MKRVFEKFYTRPMSLLVIDYWHKGEFFGIKKLTDGRMHFNPLFIYKKGKGAEIYYDINNADTDDEPMVLYFVKRVAKFKSLAKKYILECEELVRMAKMKDRNNFIKLSALIDSVWPKLALMVVIGRLYNKNSDSKIFALAYKLRKKTDRVLYLADEALIDQAKELKPRYADYINFLTSDEVISRKNIDRKELQKRTKQFIYFEGKVHTGTTIKEFEKKNNIKIISSRKLNKINSATLIEGQVAMTGFTTGRVKIIFDVNQLGKVKKGDILVTPMTIPNFISAMHRAAAFITDEGGITCHAAIIARELKKPCIIGTKIATRVLRDGDLVEVDANNGIVKLVG